MEVYSGLAENLEVIELAFAALIVHPRLKAPAVKSVNMNLAHPPPSTDSGGKASQSSALAGHAVEDLEATGCGVLKQALKHEHIEGVDVGFGTQAIPGDLTRQVSLEDPGSRRPMEPSDKELLRTNLNTLRQDFLMRRQARQ